ncbi:CcdB family protein [Pelagerythrobacter sp.]|uniref:CcdB family protein n=1 Tax=Pelagerythrobacter sp. TaxID=2800702 RepID=UPI0035B371AE
MAKFDVYRLRENSMLVVDCQADVLDDLKTRFVVPLFSAEAGVARSMRLNPTVEFEGAAYTVAPQGAATLTLAELGPPIGSLAEHDLTIGNALDMLISGF